MLRGSDKDFDHSATTSLFRCSIRRNDAANRGPLFKPSPELSADDAVRIQLDSLAVNDEPHQDHGLEVMYLFANAEGTIDGGTLPCYFGSPSDLYHFGHFALKFKTRYPDLIDHSGYQIISKRLGGESAEIRTKVRGESGDSCWLFSMSRLGPCWLTDSLMRYK